MLTEAHCQVDRGINACLGESEIGVTHYKRRIAEIMAVIEENLK